MLGRVLCWVGVHSFTTKGVPGVYLRVCRRCNRIH